MTSYEYKKREFTCTRCGMKWMAYEYPTHFIPIVEKWENDIHNMIKQLTHANSQEIYTETLMMIQHLSDLRKEMMASHI
jgi:acetone carboxylase gamma subunit